MSGDPFFVTLKSKKRKSMTNVSSNGKKAKAQNEGNTPQIKEKVTPASSLKNKSGSKNKYKKKLAEENINQEEEELNSEDDDIGPGGIDDMDFDKDSDKEEGSD